MNREAAAVRSNQPDRWGSRVPKAILELRERHKKLSKPEFTLLDVALQADGFLSALIGSLDNNGNDKITKDGLLADFQAYLEITKTYPNRALGRRLDQFLAITVGDLKFMQGFTDWILGRDSANVVSFTRPAVEQTVVTPNVQPTDDDLPNFWWMKN